MVFGAGRSLDYQHIAKLPSVNKVIMSDVVDLRGEADFINITEGTDQRFDLIIACEVVEHFTDPKTEFPRLFDLLTPEGLLVCSTNIYDGGHPNLHSYLYRRGHVSYYSPRSIGVIAKQSNMQFDFRMPKFGPPQAFGKRKRYILFSHSLKNLRKAAEYFGSHAFAPAEKPWPQAAATEQESACDGRDRAQRHPPIQRLTRMPLSAVRRWPSGPSLNVLTRNRRTRLPDDL